uniref:Immunoglobulin V-set domain-containing protein n=1 Tax=Maylandia zebra TaxID=106582 RepID=A0A3P9AV62_9CICH
MYTAEMEEIHSGGAECKLHTKSPAGFESATFLADLESEYVLLYRDNLSIPEYQHPSFKNRVDLQDRQMKDGDVSVILRDVTVSDTGTYECHVFVRKTLSWTSISSTINLHVVPPGEGEAASWLLMFVSKDVVDETFCMRVTSRGEQTEYKPVCFTLNVFRSELLCGLF